MKRTIVTGAAGFLGSHLCKQLLHLGCEVVGLDNLSTGRMENVADLEGVGAFRFLLCDIADAAVLNLEETEGAHEIYHLASPASPKFYREMPLQTIAANTVGTRHMLELANKHKAKLVYTSTSEAYGDPKVHPQHESYRGSVHTWGPRACYDESKRLGETICYEYFKRFQVEVKVARLFNTYSAGLRNDDGRVISNFVNQAIEGEAITVYGDGSQTRSFCYVDDTIRGLIRMMEADNATGEIINIGNPVEHSVLEVAKLVKRLAESSSAITFLPLPEDDPKVRSPVIEKAEFLLGWRPEIDLVEGLTRTIEAYRNDHKK
ncbi:NAD-dependent epimerase/dehydratase family protein [Paenibacillus koleovorans]|uniref:NAD-dependent epimerase/dehydratase family protein n=1 Tax=Paenibacillus koleovorans TaxID=121608 RepID=UPI001FEC5C2D|nr:NAD-dependent epimerase/dehydratase family protein [Paenibacillus koleovorans]